MTTSSAYEAGENPVFDLSSPWSRAAAAADTEQVAFLAESAHVPSNS